LAKLLLVPFPVELIAGHVLLIPGWDACLKLTPSQLSKCRLENRHASTAYQNMTPIHR
jgi:hypothetical protein